MVWIEYFNEYMLNALNRKDKNASIRGKKHLQEV